MMVLDYCWVRNFDLFLKFVYLVLMSVKDLKLGKSEWCDVVMSGIGFYWIQVDCFGDYVGVKELEFGLDVILMFIGIEVIVF